MCTIDWQIVAGLLPAIITAGTGAVVALLVFAWGRRQSRINTALDLHKEYYSLEFAKLRDRASRFIQYNYKRNWSEKPTRFDDPEDNRTAMHQVTRFFQRMAVLRAAQQIDRHLLTDLFSREVGYWAEYLFFPMREREDWSTKKDILDLIAWFENHGRSKNFQDGLAEGEKRRKKGPVLIKNASGDLIRVEREVADMFGSPAATPDSQQEA